MPWFMIPYLVAFRTWFFQFSSFQRKINNRFCLRENEKKLDTRMAWNKEKVIDILREILDQYTIFDICGNSTGNTKGKRKGFDRTTIQFSNFRISNFIHGKSIIHTSAYETRASHWSLDPWLVRSSISFHLLFSMLFFGVARGSYESVEYLYV